MKKIILSIALLFSASLFMNAATGTVASKTQIVTAKARIITPLTLANGTDGAGAGARNLEFGVIARGTSASVITVAATNAGTETVTSGDAVIVTGAGDAVASSANFYISGENNKSYSITYPSTTTINGGTGNDLTVTLSCSNGSGSTLSATGVSLFYIGGSLALPIDAVSAQYTGTFNVTVAYN